MIISIVSFTRSGGKIANEIMKDNSNIYLYRDGRRNSRSYILEKSENVSDANDINDIDNSDKNSLLKNIIVDYEEQLSLKEWIGYQFENKVPIIFVGAMGIAVRLIAPYVENKLSDSPVIVVDELGTYVISVLSGHVGGGNKLAKEIAEYIDAIPVITTATDLNKKFAVDLFAKENGLTITNKDKIAYISAKVLSGETISFLYNGIDCVEFEEMPNEVRFIEKDQKADVLISDEYIDCELWLKPKRYVIGIGCRRGTDKATIEKLVCRICAEKKIDFENVLAITSIDVKKNEFGIISFAQKHGIPFITFSAEKLLEQEGEFSTSEFVREKVGVDNVCERSVSAYCKGDYEMISRKVAENGVTVAIGYQNNIDWRNLKWQI